ncbi:retrovirus-related pol polyprotein from transposon TNT 1-94 [Tanacetum coccineum]
MSKNEDQYYDTVLNLKAKVKKNVDTVLKIGNSLQGMFMLGPKPMSFYDSNLKHGLGYANPYTLKKAISQNLKLYDASCLDDSKIYMNVRDREEILEDATKSQIKMKNKMKDPIAIQKKQNVYTIDYNKLNALYDNFVPQKELSNEQKDFPSSFISSEDHSNESLSYSSSETKPTQNSMANNNMQAEIEKVQRDSIEIQEGMKKRINILENDVQRCQKQSLDFELQLQHEKERRKYKYSLKNICETSWISKMEKLESENVSLEFQVQFLIIEQDNVKTKYQELFNSIKKTRAQTQGEINELIENAKQKTYAYADIRAQNQDLLMQISKLHVNLQNVEQGMRATSSVRRPSHRDLSFKNSVLLDIKNSSEKVEVSDRSYSKPDVASKHVALDKKIVTNDNIKNALLAKNVRIALFTTPKTLKSMFKDTTPVVSKNRFSVRTVQSTSLDTTHVVSKDKIDAVTPISDKNKVSRLGHNLFSVGQFCDGDLEIAFRSKTCYVRNLEGDDLLTRDRESNLYTISIPDMAASSPICLMSIASSTKSPFSTCKQGKSKKSSHPPKVVLSTYSMLELLHMDLCGLMRVGSINGKKYILVIVDDYFYFTWVYFLRTKDETPEIIKNFIARVELNFNAKVCKIRTDNSTEFKNATLNALYDKLGIMQQFLVACTPQQNGLVERRNRTLVEAARTMLIFSRLLEFLWAEVVSTACFTQNRSIIHTRYNKTPYELLHGRKPNVEYLYVFGSLCYPTNDRDDLGKMKPKADIGIFIGYSETSRGFRIYN